MNLFRFFWGDEDIFDYKSYLCKDKYSLRCKYPWIELNACMRQNSLPKQLIYGEFEIKHQTCVGLCRQGPD